MPIDNLAVDAGEKLGTRRVIFHMVADVERGLHFYLTAENAENAESGAAA